LDGGVSCPQERARATLAPENAAAVDSIETAELSRHASAYDARAAVGGVGTSGAELDCQGSALDMVLIRVGFQRTGYRNAAQSTKSLFRLPLR